MSLTPLDAFMALSADQRAVYVADLYADLISRQRLAGRVTMSEDDIVRWLRCSAERAAIRPEGASVEDYMRKSTSRTPVPDAPATIAAAEMDVEKEIGALVRKDAARRPVHA